jgi:hypothetical protein
VERIEGREIAEVKNGKLSGAEKYQKLSKVIERGMLWGHVREMLGEPTNYAGEGGVLYARYPAYGVVIASNWHGNGEIYSVNKCEEKTSK